MLVSSFKIELEFGLLEPEIELQESEFVFEFEFDLELEVMAELESKYLELVVAVLLV
jgi:hypothetical protein